MRTDDVEQGDISLDQEAHDYPVESEFVDDLPLVGSDDDDDLVVEVRYSLDQAISVIQTFGGEQIQTPPLFSDRV